MQPPRPAHMAPDDAAVRGMEEGDHAAALGYYPLIVGDGNGRQQAQLGHPRRHGEPHPAPAPARRRVHNSSPAPGDDCCSPCWTCFSVFLITVLLVLVSQLVLMLILQGFPSPVALLLTLPAVAVVCAWLLCVMDDHGCFERAYN